MPVRAAKLSAVSFILCCSCFFSGCGSSEITQEVASGTPTYRPGIPQFQADAFATWAENAPLVRLFLQIPHKSLSYVKRGGGYRAIFEISVRFRERRNASLVKEVVWEDTSDVRQYQATEEYTLLELQRTIPIKPEEYLLEVVLRDENSGKVSLRSMPLAVFNLSPGHPVLGKVMLREEAADGRVSSVLGFQARSGADSLRATVEAFELPRGRASNLEFVVQRYRGDSTAAPEPYSYASFTTLLGRRMLDEEHPETLAVVQRPIAADSGSQVFSFESPRLRTGVYKVAYVLHCPREAPAGDTTLQSVRYYAVNGPAFPKLSTIDEAIAAMRYINNENERRLFRSTGSETERRRLFDSLWLSFGGTSLKASALIKKYYGRVEEANRFFTTTKEGWKTDQGLLYVVFGPPSAVEQELDVRTWYYDAAGENSALTFQFKRVQVVAPGLLVENYALLRSNGYEPAWNELVRRWRTGNVY